MSTSAGHKSKRLVLTLDASSAGSCSAWLRTDGGTAASSVASQPKKADACRWCTEGFCIVVVWEFLAQPRKSGRSAKRVAPHPTSRPALPAALVNKKFRPTAVSTGAAEQRARTSHTFVAETLLRRTPPLPPPAPGQARQITLLVLLVKMAGRKQGGRCQSAPVDARASSGASAQADARYLRTRRCSPSQLLPRSNTSRVGGGW